MTKSAVQRSMDRKEFVNIRGHLNKTQKEISQLLGTSIKAVHSYEQGWRTIPGHVERQMYFLVHQALVDSKKKKSCWQVMKCPTKRRQKCPSKEFSTYKLCWFICGTLCHGKPHRTWQEKMAKCRSCSVFQPLLNYALTHE